jgi:hypothetical protein
MKLYEIAAQAIRDNNPRLAAGLVHRLQHRHGLNYTGICEYLTAHNVDTRELEEVVKEA